MTSSFRVWPVVTLVVAMTVPSASFCQARFSTAAQILGGLYAFNSENDQYILEGHKLRSEYGANVSFSYAPNSNVAWTGDIEYSRSNSHSLEFVTTLGSGASTASTFEGQVYLDEFSAEAGPRFPIYAWLRLGFGPSVALVRRTTDVPYFGIADRLNSYCIGLHGVAAATIPFHNTSSRGFYWYYALKLRYLHSITFDARGRDLTGYSQSFLTASLAAGVGYTF